MGSGLSMVSIWALRTVQWVQGKPRRCGRAGSIRRERHHVGLLYFVHAFPWAALPQLRGIQVGGSAAGAEGAVASVPPGSPGSA